MKPNNHEVCPCSGQPSSEQRHLGCPTPVALALRAVSQECGQASWLLGFMIGGPVAGGVERWWLVSNLSGLSCNHSWSMILQHGWCWLRLCYGLRAGWALQAVGLDGDDGFRRAGAGAGEGIKCISRRFKETWTACGFVVSLLAGSRLCFMLTGSSEKSAHWNIFESHLEKTLFKCLWHLCWKEMHLLSPFWIVLDSHLEKIRIPESLLNHVWQSSWEVSNSWVPFESCLTVILRNFEFLSPFWIMFDSHWFEFLSPFWIMFDSHWFEFLSPFWIMFHSHLEKIRIPESLLNRAWQSSWEASNSWVPFESCLTVIDSNSWVPFESCLTVILRRFEFLSPFWIMFDSHWFEFLSPFWIMFDSHWFEFLSPFWIMFHSHLEKIRIPESLLNHVWQSSWEASNSWVPFESCLTVILRRFEFLVPFESCLTVILRRFEFLSPFWIVLDSHLEKIRIPKSLLNHVWQSLIRIPESLLNRAWQSSWEDSNSWVPFESCLTVILRSFEFLSPFWIMFDSHWFEFLSPFWIVLDSHLEKIRIPESLLNRAWQSFWENS